MVSKFSPISEEDKDRAVKKISRLIVLNVEDADNYPTPQVFADATARAVIDNLIRMGWRRVA